MKKSKFLPDFMFDGVWNITPDFLKQQDIKGLIVDLDNTLAKADYPDPWPGVHEWLQLMDEIGIKIMILSNNTKKRILTFSTKYNYDFISFAAKPLTINFYKAVKGLGLPKAQIAMVGDQIFTDVLGGNRANLKTILVKPFEPKSEGGFFFRVKRKKEQKYINLFKEGQS